MRLQEILETCDNGPFDDSEIMLVLPTEIKPSDGYEGSAEYIIIFPDTNYWITMFAYQHSERIPYRIRNNAKHHYDQLQAKWLNSNDWKAMTLPELIDYHREITA